MSESVIIPCGDIRLEGVIRRRSPHKAAVVAHPHPLYGGSMNNNVVAAAARALNQAGWTSLCFNFRGIGASTGSYGDGVGEQDDIAACIDFLKMNGVEQTAVIGYSFGAWTAAFGWSKLKAYGVHPLVLIAPPAAFMSFENSPGDLEVGLMICGEFDDIAPPQLAEKIGRGLLRPVEPVIVADTDHFFGGKENRLIEMLDDYFKKL